jgi:hypothetical protein
VQRTDKNCINTHSQQEHNSSDENVDHTSGSIAASGTNETFCSMYLSHQADRFAFFDDLSY